MSNRKFSNTTLETLKVLDQLPDSARVRIGVVAALRACSIETVYRHIKQGKIPRPEKLGGATVWRLGDVRAHLGEAA